MRAAKAAEMQWLDIFCPGCQTVAAVDISKVDRHPEAAVASLVIGLRCSACGPGAPMPRLLELHATLPEARRSDSLS
jgi:hypothetical protein